MLADLHIHTYFSDGTMSPEEVAKEAKEKGLGLIAVTDHNNISGYETLKVACEGNSIKTIPAVELDVMLNDKYLHLLAYGFDIRDEEFLSLVKECKDKMNHGNDNLIYNMAKVYSDVHIEEYESYQYSLTRGGHKHTNFLLDKGVINSHREVFPLFNKYGIPLVELGLPRLETACEIIHNAGGVAVLAHPWTKLDRDNFLKDLSKVKEAGIDGVECFYPSHSKEITNICVDFCRQNNLLITVGSDVHGEFNKRKIGEFKVDTVDLNLKGLI